VRGRVYIVDGASVVGWLTNIMFIEEGG